MSQVKLRVKVINLYLRSTDDDTDTEVEDENQYPDDPSENDTEDVKEPRAETKTDREEAIEALLNPIKYDNEEPYPMWGELLGWCLALSSMLCVPIVAIIQIMREKGTLSERINILLLPKVKLYLFLYLSMDAWCENKNNKITTIIKISSCEKRRYIFVD